MARVGPKSEHRRARAVRIRPAEAEQAALARLTTVTVEHQSDRLTGPNDWRLALRLLEPAGLDRSARANLGSCGVGATDADAVLDAQVQARAEPAAWVRRLEDGEYHRHEVLTELTARLDG